MRSFQRAVLVVLAAGSLGGTCPGGAGIPEDDLCDVVAVSPTVVTLELGQGGFEDLFTPWSDDAPVKLVTGGQGSSMIPTRLRITGADAAGCMVQRTQVFLDDKEVASSYGPVGFYESGGARLTRSIYLVLRSGAGVDGQHLRVQAEVGGQTASRRVVVSRP